MLVVRIPNSLILNVAVQQTETMWKTNLLHKKIRFSLTIPLVCVALSVVRYNKGWDPLAEKYWGQTGYLWSHVVMYTMMGFINFFGERSYMYALANSFGWEMTEALIGASTGSLKYWTSGGLVGQAKDISANMIGYFIGKQMREFMPCKVIDCSSKMLGSYEMSAIVVVIFAVIKSYKCQL